MDQEAILALAEDLMASVFEKVRLEFRSYKNSITLKLWQLCMSLHWDTLVSNDSSATRAASGHHYLAMYCSEAG